MLETKQRSTFVTVVAWILIVLSGFGTLITLLQNVMIQLMLNSSDVAMHAPPADAPALLALMANHVGLFFFLVFAVTAVTLAAPIGLLRRANWARLTVIVLMILAAIWTLCGMALQAGVFWTVREQFAMNGASPEMMMPMLIAVGVVGAILGIGFVVLFGWIAKRLASPEIVAEFR